MKRTFTTRIEDLNVHEITTDQENADAITTVIVTLKGHTTVLTALEASAIADAIRDHLGSMRGY